MNILKSKERGFANHGWLKSFHTFSFADYFNPKFMNFKNLRVINEDCIAAGSGFSTHSHKNMEILSYVVQGSLEHKDSLGNISIIRPGEVQIMSAGSGVSHSEFNFEKQMETKFFQIWILPRSENSKPQYDQKNFEQKIKSPNLKNAPIQVLSKNESKLTLEVVGCDQDIEMWIAKPAASQSISISAENSSIWLQLISGKLKHHNSVLEAGDALYGEIIENLTIETVEESHFFYFLQ